MKGLKTCFAPAEKPCIEEAVADMMDVRGEKQSFSGEHFQSEKRAPKAFILACNCFGDYPRLVAIAFTSSTSAHRLSSGYLRILSRAVSCPAAGGLDVQLHHST